MTKLPRHQLWGKTNYLAISCTTGSFRHTCANQITWGTMIGMISRIASRFPPGVISIFTWCDLNLHLVWSQYSPGVVSEKRSFAANATKSTAAATSPVEGPSCLVVDIAPLQNSHLNSFLSSWTDENIFFQVTYTLEKIWLHKSHLNGFFFSWTEAECFFISPFREQVYSQFWHSNAFFPS